MEQTRFEPDRLEDPASAPSEPSLRIGISACLLGHKVRFNGDHKREILALIEDYRRGRVPLIVPLTLLKHHLRGEGVPEWLHRQVYLNPYPKELMLRNQV